MVSERKCFEDLEEKDDLLTELTNLLINYKVVCRTALATPGLLNTDNHTDTLTSAKKQVELLSE